MAARFEKIRCQNYIGEFNRCWNIASKLAIIQEEEDKTPSQQHQQKSRRIWICDGCFKLRLLNDRKFTDQLPQVTNLTKNKNDDIN